MNKKTTILTIILALLLTTAIVASTSQASEKRFKQGEKQNFQPGNFEEINQAMENNDYAAWKELMGDNPITEKITQDNFAKFVQAHELMREGQVEEAKAIHEELGLQGPERRGLKGDKEGDFRGNRGQKPCTEFVDADGDGVCDNK